LENKRGSHVRRPRRETCKEANEKGRESFMRGLEVVKKNRSNIKGV